MKMLPLGCGGDYRVQWQAPLASLKAFSPPADVDLSAQAPVIWYRLIAQLLWFWLPAVTPRDFSQWSFDHHPKWGFLIFHDFFFFKHNTFMPLMKQKDPNPEPSNLQSWSVVYAVKEEPSSGDLPIDIICFICHLLHAILIQGCAQSF